MPGRAREVGIGQLVTPEPTSTDTGALVDGRGGQSVHHQLAHDRAVRHDSVAELGVREVVLYLDDAGRALVGGHTGQFIEGGEGHRPVGRHDPVEAGDDLGDRHT